jgi:hypothetical protein
VLRTFYSNPNPLILIGGDENRWLREGVPKRADYAESTHGENLTGNPATSLERLFDASF